MSKYEENERALKELIQNVKSVPGTFPPVYNCGDVIIGYDRQGQFRVMASIKAKPPLPAENDWLKRWQARLTPLTHSSDNEQNLIDHWIHRWQARHWKSGDSSQQLGRV